MQQQFICLRNSSEATIWLTNKNCRATTLFIQSSRFFVQTDETYSEIDDRNYRARYNIRGMKRIEERGMFQ